MIIERRLTIRSAFNNDTQKPSIKLTLTRLLCFAHVTVGGKQVTVPGTSLAAALGNAQKYLAKK